MRNNPENLLCEGRATYRMVFKVGEGDWLEISVRKITCRTAGPTARIPQTFLQTGAEVTQASWVQFTRLAGHCGG